MENLGLESSQSFKAAPWQSRMYFFSLLIQDFLLVYVGESTLSNCARAPLVEVPRLVDAACNRNTVLHRGVQAFGSLLHI